MLAVTDDFTKWVIAIPLSNQTVHTTPLVLYENNIYIYAVPLQILSDQESHFNNQLLAAFTQLWDVHHIKSTAYHPKQTEMYKD